MPVSIDPLEQSLLSTINGYRLLEQGQRVVVAVSGGPDSVCLLLGLAALSARLKLALQVAHVNHGLRGQESDGDEEFVRNLASRLDLPCHVSRLDTAGPARIRRENLEAYARQLRYDFLLGLGAELEAVIATGHTLNDLVETFLLKLMRGAGLSGLAGIYPRRSNRLGSGREVDVIRPLIETSRAEILGYLDRQRLHYRQDSSNLDREFDRNLVRHEVIPSLEARFNPELVRTLGRTAVLLRELEEYLTPQVEEAYQRCVDRDSKGVHLLIPPLTQLPPFLRKEVVRRAIREEKGNLKDISSAHVDDILNLRKSSAEVHLPGGLHVRREFDRLVFGRPLVPVSFEYKLPVPGDVYITEVGKLVHIRRSVDAREGASIRLNLPPTPLRLRNRRPGDRYRLKATGQPRKLKEILIEKRVPRSLRDRLLIIEDGGEIVWVEGLPPNPRYGVSGPGTDAVQILVEPETFRPERLLNQ